jgi:hypothetical protein
LSYLLTKEQYVKPVTTENTDTNYVLPDGTAENDLPAYQMILPDGKVIICSVWEPTAEERNHIARGLNVRLVVWGTAQPPVTLDLTDERVVEDV